VVSPPPEISRRTLFGYDSNSSNNNAAAAALSQLLSARPNNKHRSCGCPVSADGRTIATATSCVHHHHGCNDCASSRPSLMAAAASSADAAALSSCAEQQRRRRSSSSSGADSNNSLAASFDDLEQRIKRVRLSSTPGELCWARELRDLGTLQQGWRPAGPSSSSHAHNYPHRPARGYDAVPSSLLNRNNGAALLPPSSGGEPSWYEKVLHEIPRASRDADEDRVGIAPTATATAEHRSASCRMVLEPLAPHRLALHLQYSRTLLREAWDDIDVRGEDRRHLSAFPEIRVDVRIPRHYPHEPPLVSNVRYSLSHVGDPSSAPVSGSEAAMETMYPRRAASEPWSSVPRHSMLSRVDSIVLVPFDPDGNPGGDPELLQGTNNSAEVQQDHGSREVHLEPSQRGDINDFMMDTGSAETSDQEQKIRHAVPQAAAAPWNPAEGRRELKLHGYSPVHRLSDVLERIAVALYTASPSNTTLVVPTIGGSDDDDNSTGGTSARNGSGFGRDVTDARSRHPGSSSSSSGAAREGSVMMTTFPTRSATSADAASWLSSFVATAATAAGMEADQATERHL
jgi:hypothetical protein